MKRILIGLLLLGLARVEFIQAQPLVLESTGVQTVLVELYTSEGCNSCPPAERFLNQFTHNDELWARYIPLAFHVDYWNDLGWVDRYSRPEYAQRQRHYARFRQQNTVYTPAFVVNGEPWRPGFLNKTIDPPQALAGQLRLEIDQQGVLVQFQPAVGQRTDLALHVALLGMGIESNIQAGENRGKHARHEFVVLSQHSYPPQNGRWTLPELTYSDPQGEVKSFAVAAWVSRPGEPVPIQSVGGPLPGTYVRR